MILDWLLYSIPRWTIECVRCWIYADVGNHSQGKRRAAGVQASERKKVESLEKVVR
jgi:hypothetical protein